MKNEMTSVEAYTQQISLYEERTKNEVDSQKYIVETELREIKPGLLLVRVGNMPLLPNGELRQGTWEADFGHAAIIVDEKGTLVEAIGDDHEKENPAKNSVVKITLDDFYTRGPDIYHIVWPSKGNVLATDEEGKRAADYAIRQLGLPYNWHFLKRDDDTAFYCSQLCWRAWKEQNYALDFEQLFGLPKKWVSPYDLAAARKDCRVLYVLNKTGRKM